MKNLLEFLISQRVTVTAILFLFLLFVIMPVAMFTDLFPSKYYVNGDLSASETLIAVSWIILTLIWYAGSSILKKIDKLQEEKTTDFVNSYEDGVEIFADLYTLGHSKQIGLKNVKTVIACHALFIAFILLLFIFVSAINFEYFVALLENWKFPYIMLSIYIAFMVFFFKIVKSHID